MKIRQYATAVLSIAAVALSSIDIGFWLAYGKPVLPQFGYLIGFDVLLIVGSIAFAAGALLVAALLFIKPIRKALFKRWNIEDGR